MQTLRLCNWGIFFIIGVENKNMIAGMNVIIWIGGYG
jgi:hypothetical protein